MNSQSIDTDITELLQDFDIQHMVSVMRHIFLDYTGKHAKHGLPVIVIENISGIVILLDYLDGLEPYQKENAA
jgi:hypothetical protein